jgi:pimeloyl-ACP methyl ester carboxylesterase
MSAGDPYHRLAVHEWHSFQMEQTERDIDVQLPTIVTIPCFSGAPWNLKELECLSDIPMQTMRLPEGKDDIEDYADFVGAMVDDLECYVLAGDSFGAVVSLALAIRQPPGLRALILSGGFA